MSSTSFRFRVGDRVVYPNHGVGTIETIRPDRAGEGEYYLLHISTSNLRVLVPRANADTVGLRPVSAAADLLPVLRYLEQAGNGNAAARSDWKTRFRENSIKLRGGALQQVAEVLKGLAQLHTAKRLSTREKKMLDRAALLLASELACAQALSLEDALSRLQSSLAKAQLTLPPLNSEEVAS
ncbi:MAG: CarD family transcriptional regulator [Terriglobales bacterium]